MTNQFYSSLVINGTKFPNIHQVFKPRYNKEFFKRLLAKTDQIESIVKKRCKSQLFLQNYDINNIKTDATSIIKLREQCEKLEKKTLSNEAEQANPQLDDIKAQIRLLEDRLMPIAIALPNRVSKQVPEKEELVVETSDSDLNATKENLHKVLSHVKLSYINNCYSKSVIGPNSHYYSGIGAKVQHGISDYFSHELESKDFIHLSGMCLAKSAVVEAANSIDNKDYKTDPCRVLTDPDKYTTLHLVEASREAMLGFVTTLGPRGSNNSLRFMTAGAGYRSGTDWFDSDIKRVSQFETLHSLAVSPSIETYSMREYDDTRKIIWNIYKKLKLPTRLVQCSIDSMHSNEYDASRIDIYLPYSQRWLEVGRISHYLDYITVRSGMKRGHIIDSMVYDGQVLFAGILENNQTATGKFIVPYEIKKHMIAMSKSEEAEYFREPTSNYSPTSGGKILNNYDQRRYLVKRSYVFSHSRKAAKERVGHRRRVYVMLGGTLAIAAAVIDWYEVWASYISRRVKRFSYNCLFRPVRRFWWFLTYPDPTRKPPDLTYDEVDWSWEEKSPNQRNKDAIAKVEKPRR